MFGNDFDVSAIQDMMNEMLDVETDAATRTLRLKVKDMAELQGADMGPMSKVMDPGKMTDPGQLKQLMAQFGGLKEDSDVEFDVDQETGVVTITFGEQEAFEKTAAMFDNIGELFGKLLNTMMKGFAGLMDAFGGASGDADADAD